MNLQGDIAIVHDEPGVTRDRLYSRGFWGKNEFMLVDTGGVMTIPKSESIGMWEVCVYLASLIVLMAMWSGKLIQCYGYVMDDVTVNVLPLQLCLVEGSVIVFGKCSATSKDAIVTLRNYQLVAFCSTWTL
jgi:hypothetical protein